MSDSVRPLNDWAVLAATITHGLNRFARDYATAMVLLQDRMSAVPPIAIAEQASTPDQRRAFALSQLAGAPDSEALEAVRRYCLRNHLR